GDYYRTKAIAYRNDRLRGAAYSDSSATWAEKRMRGQGGINPNYEIIWATGLAGSGRQELAAVRVKRLLRDSRYTWNPLRRELAAEACVLTAMYDCAIEQLRLAMAWPLVVNGPTLRLDPIWDPLRGRADF